MEMSTKHVIIYCVNYNSYDCLHNYLLSIDNAAKEAIHSVDVQVVVADNSAPVIPTAYTPDNFSLHVFPTGQNRGYFGAVRYAMGKIQPTDYDYTIISNVDLTLTKDFFTSLTNRQTEKDTGWIAPAILSKTHHIDFNPQAINRYSPRKMRLLRLMFRYPLLMKLKRKLLHHINEIKDCKPGQIYAGHGSLIILTKEFIKRCGIIDYPVFLFGEEIFLAELCRKNGMKVIYDPDIIVNDIGSVSTSKILKPQFCRHNYEAIDYLIKTFY